MANLSLASHKNKVCLLCLTLAAFSALQLVSLRKCIFYQFTLWCRSLWSWIWDMEKLKNPKTYFHNDSGFFHFIFQIISISIVLQIRIAVKWNSFRIQIRLRILLDFQAFFSSRLLNGKICLKITQPLTTCLETFEA